MCMRGNLSRIRICRGSDLSSLEALSSSANSIREAAARGAALRIRGGGSKDFYGNQPRGELLDTRTHAGIVDYEPTELVVTARCGTSLSDLERILAEKGQMLAFEPPHFGAGRDARRLRRGRSLRPAPRQRGLGARRHARREDPRRTRAAARLRRTGDEERRRLRRVAPACGIARHARPDRRGIPQAAAAAAGGADAEIRDAAGEGAGEAPALGRPAAADIGQRLARRRAARCACRAPRARCAPLRKAWAARAVPAGEAARFWTGIREHDRSVFRRRGAALAPVAAVAGARARPAAARSCWSGAGRCAGCARRGRGDGAAAARRWRARGRPCDAVPRRGQAAGRVRAAAAAACAPAPRPEARPSTRRASSIPAGSIRIFEQKRAEF